MQNTRPNWQAAMRLARTHSFIVAIVHFPQFADQLKKVCWLRNGCGDSVGSEYRFRRALKNQGVIAAFFTA